MFTSLHGCGSWEEDDREISILKLEVGGQGYPSHSCRWQHWNGKNPALCC